MRTSDFDYDLPPPLIAQTPAEPRDSCRLLVLHRQSGAIEHSYFHRLGQYLCAGDLLVLNDSRVIPARLYAEMEGTGRPVEVLLLHRVEEGLWQAVGRPGRRLRRGSRLRVRGPASVTVEVMESGEDGLRVVRLSTEEGMETWGHTPLPPYIHEPLADPENYQTVYARVPGSAAAPTAGLHFTRELLESLAGRGVRLAYLTLHVGLDTFQPVHEEDPRQHRVHTEYFHLGEGAAAEINAARREGRRIVAVGTTAVRTLEQAAGDAEAQGMPELQATSGWAGIFILPGHRFRLVDAMVTNFHLPRSTTLMLAAAFAGWDKLLAAYQEAIQHGYRFYSFGDGTLIL